MSTRENHTKFVHALCMRDIRRLTAKVRHATHDGETADWFDRALRQLELRVSLLAFHDPLTDSLVLDRDTYADGRPVTTTIGWGDGYATLVHCPEPSDGTSGIAAEELSEEMWPGE